MWGFNSIEYGGFMGTRATIQFKDRADIFYIYRGHDGFPEEVLADIEKVIRAVDGRWSGAETELLVTCMLMMANNPNSRIPDYSITGSFHGDESYRYYVEWTGNGWTVRVE